MGKKQGEASRVKGNAKPSSSAKAAEMLSQIPNYSFGTDMPPIGIGTLMEDSFDSNIDSDFRMCLRKLSKKDTLTKTKTLEELKNLIDTKPQEDCVNIVSYWAKSYTKLSIDNDRKIRELCQQTHEKLCSKVTKNLAPHIKTIMPYWLMAQCDSHLLSSKIADNCFKTMFNEVKQPEVVYFCRDEVLNTLQDFLLIQTAKSLSDMKSTSEDEAVQKYENILSMSLKALGLFLKYFLCDSSKVFKEKFDWDKLEKILLDQKFLKFSKHQNQRVRADFFGLLYQVVDMVLLNKNLINLEIDQNFKFRKNLRQKVVPLIFYALDEDDEISCYFIWQSILKCLVNSDSLDSNCDNLWTLLNVKKAFIPKLISLMRSHANGNANVQNVEIIYPCLSKLLECLTRILDSREEKFNFFKEYLEKIYEFLLRDLNSIQKIRFSNSISNRVKILGAYFESIFLVLNDFNLENNDLADESIQFCENIIFDQVSKLFELYLDSNSQTVGGYGFESNFDNFLSKINTNNNDRLQFKSTKFISNLNEKIFEKIESEQSLEKQLNILHNYLNLNLKERELFTKIFKSYFCKINERPESLIIVNFLTSKYFDRELILNLIIEHQPGFDSHLSNDHKLRLFKIYCDTLCKRQDNLLQKVEFYILVLLKFEQADKLLKDLNNLVTEDKIDEAFFTILIDDLKSKKFGCEINQVLIDWIKFSESLRNFIKNILFENLVSNSRILFELSHILNDQEFRVQIIEKIYNNLKEKLELDEALIELNLNLLNQGVQTSKNSQLLWKILFEYFRIKISKNLHIDTLDTLIKKLINSLITENELEPLKQFITSSLNEENSQIVEILHEIQSEILKNFDSEFYTKFTRSLMVSESFNFKDTFVQLVQNEDILSKLFLNKRLNYLFTNFYWGLIRPHKLDSEWLSTVNLNKITYSLSQLNSYLNLESSDFNSDWYYLILTSILVKKFYTGCKKLNNFTTEFDNLFLKNNFLQRFYEKINSENESLETFLSNNFTANNLLFDLNSFSLFLTYSIDLTCQKDVELIAQNVMSFLISLYSDEEESIKLFLYDIPFARQSVMDNLDNLIDNLDHYYMLFSSVLEGAIEKLEFLTEALVVLNKNQDLALLETNLQGFNLTLDLIVKYTSFYFDLLKNKNDAKLDAIFNSNPKTSEFIQTNLSKYILKVLDMLLRIKDSINQNLDLLVKNLSLEEYGSGYFFYFNFTIEPKKVLDWNEFNFSYKINNFLTLIFTDLPQNEQLAIYLSDKQWDFILCYSAAMSQRLKKPLQSSLNDKNYIQLKAISFYEFLFNLTNCLNIENLKYPEKIRSEFKEFFSREIQSPILVNFVKISEYFEGKNLSYLNSILINKTSNLLGQINYENLVNNDLEPKFNVLDLDINFLSDQIKTIFNYLTPYLKHKNSSIQIGSYKILRILISNIGSYFNDETETKVLDSLPFVFRDLFHELTDLFSDLKKTVEFDQSILHFDEEESLTYESNNKIMSYLFVNKLVLDMFTSSNLQFKVKLASNLRELNFSDYLMHCLFRLMPKSGLGDKFSSSEMVLLDEENFNFFQNYFVENFSCKIYKQALKMCPAMIRDWWNMQPKRIADQVDKFTTRYVSPNLIEEEIRQINRSANLLINESGSEDESSIKVKGMTSTREIVSTYKMKELSMDLLIQLPINYPLGVVSVSSAKRLGVSENEWRNWLLQLTTYLTHQNGSIIQGLQIWKRNVDKKFSGVEECTICYSVIHGTNYQLPKMKCRTCKHMFHSVCLYKWFESSSKSSCPLCRNLF